MSEVSENAAVRGEGGPDVAAPGDRSGTLRAEVDDSCDPKVAQIPRFYLLGGAVHAVIGAR